jgi:hypothetical protein
VGTTGWEGRGVDTWQVGTSKVVAPACVDMGPVSLVVGCQQELDFSPLLFGCCGREAGYGPVNRMAVVIWIMSGALLLGCSGSVQIC